MPTLLLGAVLARCPRGSAGHTCAVMNWALAFRHLGWEVHLVECLRDSELEAAEDDTVQEHFWHQTCAEFGFPQSLLVLDDHGRPALTGPHASRREEAWERFTTLAETAEAFLNYSGQFRRLDLLGSGVRKIYLDVDPAFTQLWAEVSHCDMNFSGHDAFWTIGRNIGSPDARLPLAGLPWQPTFPVVAAEAWAQRLAAENARLGPPNDLQAWTTVGHWYGYGAMPWQGQEYTGKRESFLALRELPRQCAQRLLLATDLQREWGDLTEFEAAGWSFACASEICRDVPSYLRFLAGSRGEIGVAKGGYTMAHCGWISDRSLVYLSLGKPVLAQQTGWSKFLGSHAGLRSFTSVAEAARQLQQMEENYSAESAGAARLARSTFSPEEIIPPLLASLG